MKTRTLFLLSLASGLFLYGCTTDSKGKSTPTEEEPAKACEGIDLNTSNDHCGECNHKCGDHQACVQRECKCVDGWYDCDGDGACESDAACAPESCEEADPNTSNEHCGRCNHKCGANSACSRGDCRCDDGWYDCDHDDSCESRVACSSEPQNSCEGTDPMTSNQHCGKCNHACVNAQCQQGECVCDEGRVDCDGDGNCECLHGTCESGQCKPLDGYFDCDENGTYETQGECACRPGQTTSCYTGNENDKRGVTKNADGEVIIKHGCQEGYRKCIVDEFFGAYWSEICYNERHASRAYRCDDPLLDLDCDGVPETMQDDDHDNHAICKDGQLDDCCDNSYQCAFIRDEDRGKIHSERLECIGNTVDDNCNGEIDEGTLMCGEEITVVSDSCVMKERTCDNGLVKENWNASVNESASSTGPAALSLLKAMDICLDIGTADSLGDEGGIIEYSLHKAGKEALAVHPDQVNFLPGMENKQGIVRIAPRVGKMLALLSSGLAIDVKNANNSFVKSQKYDYNNDTGGDKIDNCSERNAVPEVFISKHTDLTTNDKCKSDTKKICDSAVLHLKLKAPKTANGFSFDFRFFSREYPYFVCSEYNDIFLAILTDESGQHPLVDRNGNGSTDDEDGNIAFDKQGSLLSVNNAFFTTCNAPKCGDYEAFSYLNNKTAAYYYSTFFGKKFDNNKWNRDYGNSCTENLTCTDHHCGTCEDGGTDLDAYFPSPYTGEGMAGNKDQGNKGGGTAWLTTQAPIEGGQVFNLDFYIWDTGDSAYDSTVILDNFQWLCSEEPITVGTDFAKPIEQTN